MLLRLTVADTTRTPRRGRSDLHEVEVEAPAGTTCMELTASLVDLLEMEPTGVVLSVSGRPVADESPVGSRPLVDGAAVSLGPHGCTGTTAPSPRSPVTLAVVHGPDAGRMVELGPGRHTIGRGAEADVRVDDGRLSRLHAALEVDASGIRVRDLGSTNGSFVDGDVVEGPTSVDATQTLRVGDTSVVVRASHDLPAALVAEQDGTRSVNRRPRLRHESAAASITLPVPPDRPHPARVPWVAMVLPVPFAAVLAMFFGPTMLAFALMSPLLMGGTALGDRLGSRRRYAAQAREHALLHAAALHRVEEACALEARSLRRSIPDPAELLAIAAQPSARLWERGRSDEDFLALGIGQCSRESRIRVIRPPGDDGPGHAPLTDVPCTVPLRGIGTLGICGARPLVESVTRALMGQLVVLHSPLDLDVVVVGAHPRAPKAWDWLPRLPHLRGPDGAARAHTVSHFTEDPASARESVLRLASKVRERLTTGATGEGRWNGRWTLLLLDGAASLRGLPELTTILELGPRVGVCCLALDDDPTRLPAEAAAVLDLNDPAPTLTGHGLQQQDLMVDAVGPWWAERISRALAPVRDATSGEPGSALPTAASLTGVSGQPLTDPAAIVRLWSEQPHRTAIPLGVGAAGPYTVDLATDGPHVLVAGTTGSGKSELLRTLVTSLAAHNRPEHLSFVLIDYKGGSAFAECADLPHASGVVTDLDEHLAARALTSMRAELTRRERLLALAGVANFLDYQSSSRAADHPLARLVVVIDEFRALAEEVPAFVDGIVRVAALGRSLGVHVVLATQRPSGVVTGDIKANVNLRIALRVRDRADSADVVDSPHAAEIDATTPGRAVARAGGGDLVAFQCAHVGAAPVSASPQGIRARLLTWGVAPEPWPQSRDSQATTELGLVVKAIRRAATDLRAGNAPPAWLPCLPAQIPAQSLPPPPHGLSVPIGLADRPGDQTQLPLYVDLREPGHWGFLGTSGSGRTTALVTVARSLTAHRGPDGLHLYAVSGGSLTGLSGLPHCGAHVEWSDLARLDRLVARLVDEVAARRRALSVSGQPSMQRWWESGAPQAPPPVLLLVDDWDLLAHHTDGPSHGALAEGLLGLLRDGLGVGVTAVVSGDRALLVGRVASALRHRVVLRLAEGTDAALAGLSPAALPLDPPPGRGLLRDGTEVQVAQPPPPSTGPRPRTTTSGPRRVDALPLRVRQRELPRHDLRPDELPLGVGGDESRVQGWWPRRDGRRWLVSGPARSGVSTTLALIVDELMTAGRPVAVVEARPGPLDALRQDARLALWADARRPEPLVALRHATPTLAVVVDGADELTDSAFGAPLLEMGRLVDHDDGLVVCGTSTASLATAYRGLAVEVARHRTGILLGPGGPAASDVFGLRLTPDPGAGAGRGHIIREGIAVPLQVALPDLGGSDP